MGNETKRTYKIGICLPSKCSSEEIQNLYLWLGFAIDIPEINCVTSHSQKYLDAPAMAAIVIFVIVLMLMLISTTYHIKHHYRKTKPSSKLLMTFSILANGKSLLKMNTNPNQLSCLHGIRVLSVLLIMTRHIQAIFYKDVVILNYTDIDEWWRKPDSLICMLAFASVESFFLISGLLVSYNFMLSYGKGFKFNIFTYYINRYLRLTPAYAMVILSSVSLIQYLHSGPQWASVIRSNLVNPCKTNWWINLIYLQNYINQGPLCLLHSWYLAVDMHLFLLSPLLLLPLSFWPRLKIPLLLLLIVLSSPVAFVLSLFKDYKQTFFQSIFFISHTRFSSWLIGFGTGYIVYDMKNKQSIEGAKNKILIHAFWVVDLIILFACLFVAHYVYNNHGSVISYSALISFLCPIWCVAMSAFIVACVQGYGGIINWILSNSLMEVISKFSYSMYLTHLLIIYIRISSTRVPFMFETFELMYPVLADFTATLMLSVFWVLGIEYPIGKLIQLILRKQSSKADK